MARSLLAVALIGAIGLTACTDDPVTMETDDSPLGVSAARAPAASNPGVEDAIHAEILEMANRLQADLGPDIRIFSAAWYGNTGEEAMGNTVFFEDRGNKNLTFAPLDPRGIQWVAGDPRRGGRTNINYVTVPGTPAGLTQGEVDGAIDAAVATWSSQTCSGGLSVDKAGPLDTFVDITNFGFVPLAPPTIAVTFFGAFFDPATGAFTDIDGDNNVDYAIALIFYNSLELWGIDTNTFPFVDLETVALHETGHALAQAHFGKAFASNNGKIHFAPRAVMNAGYSGLQQSIGKTDNAGHCSIWGSWPNN